MLHSIVRTVPGCRKQREEKVGLSEFCSPGVCANEYLDNVVLCVEVWIFSAVEFLITYTVITLKCLEYDGDVAAKAPFLIVRQGTPGIVDKALGRREDMAFCTRATIRFMAASIAARDSARGATGT